MSNNEPRRAGQKGFTLIEALVVMIVGIVILAAAAAGIGKLFRTSEIANEAENITQISANLRNLRNGGGDYRDISNEVAIQFKAIPATMATDKNNQIYNTWNDLVIVSPNPGSRGFIIWYFGVPPEACQQLTLKLRNIGSDGVGVGDGLVTQASSLSSIAELCEKDNHTMKFYG